MALHGHLMKTCTPKPRTPPLHRPLRRQQPDWLTGAWWGCAGRPRGRLYGPYLGYSGDAGAVTDQQSVAVVAVFSEPVTGVGADSFTVVGPATGASVAGVKLVQGTTSYYHAVVNLPASYYGRVQVTMTVSGTCLWNCCAIVVDGIRWLAYRV